MSKENSGLFDFEKLIVYQKSLDTVDFIYDMVDNDFPSKEIYALSQQFKRAVYSIPLNIGEGSGGSGKEFIQFLVISKRSLRECVVCSTIAFRRKYITDEIHNKLRSQFTELAKMLSGLIAYLESDRAKNMLKESQEDYGIEDYSLDPDYLSANSQLPTPN
jgi:four helix bundle protein